MFAPTTFRQLFPEFQDPAVYTDVVLEFWANVATVGDTPLLDPDRWGSLLDAGTGLFVAHHVALAMRDQSTAYKGGVPGSIQGPTASKSVDKVSVSYDTSAVSMTDAAFWNMTSYGVRFLTYARLIGAGGIQM